VVLLDAPNLPARISEQCRRLKAEDREDLRDRDRKQYHLPECLQRRLLERQVSRNVDVAAEEGVKVLAHKEPQRSKHANAPVLQLHFPVELDLALGDVVR